VRTNKTSAKIVVEQLIRAPLPLVFSSFVEPKVLKKFWLSKASGPLQTGKTVTWDFNVRGATDAVKVLVLETNQRIRIKWSNQSTTEWTFTALKRNQTLVRIEQAGFTGNRAAIIGEVADTAQGFAYVLSDLKVLLERGISSGVVKDKAILIERAMQLEKRKK